MPTLVDRLCARCERQWREAGLPDEAVMVARAALRVAIWELAWAPDADVDVQWQLLRRLARVLSLQGMDGDTLALVLRVLWEFPG